MRQTVLPGFDRPDAGDPGLVVPRPSGRFAALLDQNRRLLRRVTLKRRALARLHEELREHGTRAAARLEPLTDRLSALDAEIHRLFAAVLKSRKLSRRERSDVQAVYELLQAQEAISPRPDPGERRRAVEDDPPWAEPAGDLPSAARPAEENGKGALRELFLRLAHALHPDRAPESEDAGSRTEAMKDVNRAYRDGDLARLLEIERTWDLSRVVAQGRDAQDRRVQELERTNQALAAQLKTLDREHKELKRSDLAKLAAGTKSGLGGLEEMVQQAEAEVARLSQLRDHLQAFRNGEISAETFLLGTDGEDDDGDGMNMEEALAFMAGWIEYDAPPQTRGGGKRPPGRKRRPRGR